MRARSELATLGGRACPVCDGETQAAIDIGHYRLLRCPSCECWCSDAHVRYAETSFTPTSYFENNDADRDKWETLLGHLEGAGSPLGSVLDVGCGSGAFLRFIGERHPEALRVGIELDADRAELAREENPGADVHTGDAFEVLGGTSGRFDLITLWDVFEHVPDPSHLLEALSGKLSERGCVFIQTIHEQSLVPALGRLSYRLTAGRLQGPVRRTHEAHHLVFFSRKGLSLLAEKAGLRVRDRWFDRLSLTRMDGNPLLTAATAIALALENALGNGLFVNLILEAGADSGSP